MVFRMVLPLGAALALDRVSILKGTGIFGLIVVFYLLTLIVETWLSLTLMRDSGSLASGDAAAAMDTVDRSRGVL
jgi:hypothetical protein